MGFLFKRERVYGCVCFAPKRGNVLELCGEKRKIDNESAITTGIKTQ